jgi:hypothetical protein
MRATAIQAAAIRAPLTVHFTMQSALHADDRLSALLLPASHLHHQGCICGCGHTTGCKVDDREAAQVLGLAHQLHWGPDLLGVHVQLVVILQASGCMHKTQVRSVIIINPWHMNRSFSTANVLRVHDALRHLVDDSVQQPDVQ